MWANEKENRTVLIRFLNIQTSDSTNELKSSKKQLKKATKAAEASLRDVQTTVNVVESDRSSFPHITDRELYERTAFVHTSQERLRRAREESQKEKLRKRPTEPTTATTTPTLFQQPSPHQQQSMVLQQHQEETLDDLGVAVTRVNHMAETIHDEIGQQTKMLGEMEEDLANAEEELGMVMGKLAKFLRTKNQWQLGTIVCLSITVVVLFFMVLYF